MKFEACMDVMDLLYENEETSVLYSSPEALAASVVVCSLFLQLQSVLHSLGIINFERSLPPLQVIAYIITVPAQRWEFPVLPWGKSSSITNKGSIYSLRHYCLTLSQAPLLLTADLKATIGSNKALTTKILQYHKPDTVVILVLQNTNP